jgi:hypothetical protein
MLLWTKAALCKQLFGLLEEYAHFGNEKILELLS